MKATDYFKKTIKDHLDQRAATDELFAKSYAKPNKSIDECCNYILTEVQKSGCQGFADEEIFSMAIHYYDEDDIKVSKSKRMKVVVNHTIDLTEKEKEAAREAAIKKIQNELYVQVTKKPVKPKKKVEDVQQMTLF